MKKLYTYLTLIFFFSLGLTAMANEDCDGYRTQTPGGWGAPANGNNPGVYRDAHFDDAFPEGLTIGCEENSLTLTSAAAVQNYLPCGGPSQVLNGSYVDPDCIHNVFTGHLVALTLSAQFDLNDEDFSDADGDLVDAVLNNGPFEGWTVGELLALANEVIGGCNDEYSANSVKSALAMVNENFVDGDQNNGNLDCDEECPDTEDPIVESAPEDLDLNCSDDVPFEEPVFSDEDDDLDIEFSEEENLLECALEIIRTWTATDDCENSTTVTQTITLTDDSDPYWTSLPDDLDLECDDEIPYEEPTADDDCSSVSVQLLDEENIPTECPSEYTIVRTFQATDDCNNSIQHVQTIEVSDNTAPTLSPLPGNMTLDCDAIVPEPPLVEADDNCDENVVVDFSEVEIGGEGNEEADLNCVLSDPEMDDPVWSLILFDMPYGTQYYNLISGTFSEFADMGDGMTATVSATVVCADNPDAGYIIDLQMDNGENWTDWQNEPWPNTYKDDLNIAGDNYLDWTYYLISDATTLTGWGDYAGTVLNIEHAPSSFYYAYQVGIAANNVSGNYGHGGWFTATGTFMDSSTGVNEEIVSSGDFAFEQTCCDRPPIERTWTATDCAGNTVSHTQLISFQEEEGPGIVAPQASIEIDIEELFPNPTTGIVNVIVTTNQTQSVDLVILSTLGTKIKTFPIGQVEADIPNQTTLDLNALARGIYFIQAESGTVASEAAKLLRK